MTAQPKCAVFVVREEGYDDRCAACGVEAERHPAPTPPTGAKHTRYACAVAGCGGTVANEGMKCEACWRIEVEAESRPAPVRGLDFEAAMDAWRSIPGATSVDEPFRAHLNAQVAEIVRAERSRILTNLGVCDGCPMEHGASADCVIGMCDSPFGKEQTRLAQSEALRALVREWQEASVAVREIRMLEGAEHPNTIRYVYAANALAAWNRRAE